jgi:putative transport protein
MDHLAQSQPVAWAVMVLSAVAVLGLAFAAIKVRGVGIGIAGVLFAGILIGHWGFAINEDILAFVREFGLILFVFTIGLQLGPSFFASLSRHGLKLNALAAALVLLGVAATLLVAAVAGLDVFSAVGLFSGATTNTPALGAAQQTVTVLATQPGSGIDGARAALPALAYGIGYPVGVFGIIGMILLLQKIFRIDLERETADFNAAQRAGIEPIHRMNLLVENTNLDGLELGALPGRRETSVNVSRIKRAGSDLVEVASEYTVLHVGDTILAVGSGKQLEAFRLIVGRLSDVDLMRAPGQVAFRRVVVTRKDVLGKTIAELGLD